MKCISLLLCLFCLGRAVALEISDCLLPAEHPLQSVLKTLFQDKRLFDSADQLKKAGFQVRQNRVKSIMVISHPALNNYVVKKKPNLVPLSKQLSNYFSRIEGSRKVAEIIDAYQLKNIVVPQKWLYLLPPQFNDSNTDEPAYLLVAEKIEVLSAKESAFCYKTISFNRLRELCIIVYHLSGLDSILENMPFTRNNKIAFVDTEKWKEVRPERFWKIKKYLSKDRYEYAQRVFSELKVGHQNG